MRAASLAAELSDAGHETSIEEGGNGQFDVLSEGQLLFSKKREGRFPALDEISVLLLPDAD